MRATCTSASEDHDLQAEQSELHVQYEDADTLQAMCQEWIDKLAQFSSVYAVAKPAEQRARARLKVISGNVGEGLKLMRKARELAQRMSMPYDEALALSLLSRHT